MKLVLTFLKNFPFRGGTTAPLPEPFPIEDVNHLPLLVRPVVPLVQYPGYGTVPTPLPAY